MKSGTAVGYYCQKLFYFLRIAGAISKTLVSFSRNLIAWGTKIAKMGRYLWHADYPRRTGPEASLYEGRTDKADSRETLVPKYNLGTRIVNDNRDTIYRIPDTMFEVLIT